MSEENMNRISLYLLLINLAIIGMPGLAAETDSDEPVYIEANSATYNDSTGESVYIGDVIVTQGRMRMTSDKLVIHMTDKQVEKIVATGNPVRFKQEETEDKEEVRGKAQQAEYYVNEDRLLLLDKAVVWQGGNTYASDRIEYDRKNMLVKAGKPSSGSQRVHVTLNPKNDNEKKKKD
jgi:lipopolysaccharide export system protein LptA